VKNDSGSYHRHRWLPIPPRAGIDRPHRHRRAPDSSVSTERPVAVVLATAIITTCVTGRTVGVVHLANTAAALLTPLAVAETGPVRANLAAALGALSVVVVTIAGPVAGLASETFAGTRAVRTRLAVGGTALAVVIDTVARPVAGLASRAVDRTGPVVTDLAGSRSALRIVVRTTAIRTRLAARTLAVVVGTRPA